MESRVLDFAFSHHYCRNMRVRTKGFHLSCRQVERRHTHTAVLCPLYVCVSTTYLVRLSNNKTSSLLSTVLLRAQPSWLHLRSFLRLRVRGADVLVIEPSGTFQFVLISRSTTQRHPVHITLVRRT